MNYLFAVLTTLLSAGGAFLGVLFSARSNQAGVEKQSRGQATMKVAEFRQAWINQLRDTMAEFCGIIITPGTQRKVAEERFHNLHCKIELLMNPKDPAYPELSKLLSLLATHSSPQKDADTLRLVVLCQEILKREWETLKREVGHPTLALKSCS